MKRCLSLLISFIFFGLETLAGGIKGQVTDASAEPATGAVIALEGETGATTVAGLDGSFRFAGLPAGSYTLTVTSIGFRTVRQELNLVADEEQAFTISLETDQGRQLNEVTIGGKRDGGSEQTARNMEKDAAQVMNIVSARAIQLSPDLTVANVIQRVSGISIERNSNGDGQHAILRGMDKRYNYTMVNGVKIPSPDNKYRYVPLDIFPAELLDRLEVYKALTPDMEGDAIGGAVNMVMKDAPDRLSLSASLATGYSELFAGRDFTGYASGDINRQSPYELHGKQYSATNADFPAAPFHYNSGKPMPHLLGGLSLGNRFLNGRLGVILAGSYQNTYRGANSLLFGMETVDTFKGVTLTERDKRNFSEQQTRSGLHLKADYRFNERHKLQWYNAYLSLVNTQVREVVGQQLTIGGYDPVNGNATLDYSTRSRITLQHIYNSTLQGDHQLYRRLRLKWSAVYSMATNERPDNTTINLHGEEKAFVQTITKPGNSSRRWEHNEDQDLTGYLNLTYDRALAGIPAEWSIGGMYRDKQRSSFYNQYQFTPVDPTATYGIDFTNYSDIDWRLGNPKGSVGSAANYDAWEKITAGYAQFKLKGQRLEVTGGLRAEHTDQGYEMMSPLGEDHPDGSQVYTDLLPSLHFRYIPNKKTNLRASYFRSVNRPGFFEIVPARTYNEEYQERGNQDLQHAVADNADLRYELFPRAGEMLMAGIFYKYIKNPIEYTLQLDPIRAQDVFYTPGNFGNATNYGVELDFIKYFRHFGIKGNYTYTHSRITTQKAQRIRDENTGDVKLIYPEQTRPLYGQAAHIANLSLLYKDAAHGWDAQLAANYTGSRIAFVSQFLDGDVWQRGFIQLDCSAEKTFKNHLGVFIKINNILNTPMETYVKGQSSRNLQVPDQDLDGNTLIQRDFYQRSYLLGVRYKL